MMTLDEAAELSGYLLKVCDAKWARGIATLPV